MLFLDDSWIISVIAVGGHQSQNYCLEGTFGSYQLQAPAWGGTTTRTWSSQPWLCFAKSWIPPRCSCRATCPCVALPSLRKNSLLVSVWLSFNVFFDYHFHINLELFGGWGGAFHCLYFSSVVPLPKADKISLWFWFLFFFFYFQ